MQASNEPYISAPKKSTKKSPVLVEPLFRYSEEGDKPYTPTSKEIVWEWLDAINFIKYPTRSLAIINFCFHFLTSIVFFIFILSHLSLPSFIFMIISIVFLVTIYNTLWYHRYCSHLAFTFKKGYYTLFFLWTNARIAFQFLLLW